MNSISIGRRTSISGKHYSISIMSRVSNKSISITYSVYYCTVVLILILLLNYMFLTNGGVFNKI